MFDDIVALFKDILPDPVTRLLLAVVVFAMVLWLAKTASRLLLNALKRGHADEGLISFSKSVSRVTAQIIAIFFALVALGVPVGSIVTFISAGFVAVGLALRESLSNVASGIIILFTKPFSIGDYVEVEGRSGTVTGIMIMSTRLLTPDNKRVMVPNSMMVNSIVINSSREDTRRVDMLFTIGYDADLGLAMNVIIECAERTGLVLPDPEPRCVVKEQGQHGVVLGTIMWCKKENYLETTYMMNRLTKEAFDEAGIYLPVFEVHTNN